MPEMKRPSINVSRFRKLGSNGHNDDDEATAGMLQVAEALQNAGAAAVTIHGRTMEQRYKRAADWQLVQQTAHQLTVPVIGNGDVLTYYEVWCHIVCWISMVTIVCCMMTNIDKHKFGIQLMYRLLEMHAAPACV